MPVPKQVIQDLLALSFPNDQITLHDFAGDADHYAITIVSSRFEGMSRLQRHQMVYKALQEKMIELHALSLKTLTPQEAMRE